MTSVRCRRILVFVVALLMLPSSARSQSVTGRITATENGQPLVGAFVRLFDDSGQQRSAILTDAMGRYHLAAPEPGLYRLRAEFIGRDVVEMGPVELSGSLSREWSPSLSPKPIPLWGLTVRGSRRCVIGPEEGTALASVWEEAQKALEVAAWAARQEFFQYELLGHRRELDRERVETVEDQGERWTSYRRQPFISRPAEDLILSGFVQETAKGTFAYAPDAQVLLSDAFLRAYCFRLTEDGEGRIGLAFEPIRGRRVPDIEGVMWLDRESSELRSVTYTYRRFPGVGRAWGLGGEVDFERLHSGAWIVRRWRLETPIWADVMRAGSIDRSDRRVVGIMEYGAEVLKVVDLDGDVILVADRATLSGAVFDSIRGRPLPGAEIRLMGTDYRRLTEVDGTFLIADLPGGRYSLEIAHPRLDSLNIDLDGISLWLEPGETTRVTVAVPRAVPAAAEEELHVRGEVLEASDETAIQGARVSLFDRSGQATGTVETDERGSYELVAPYPARYRVRVEVQGRETVSSDPFDVEASTRVFHSFLFDGDPIRPQPSDAAPAGVVVTPSGLREGGTGVRVIGTVEARESGEPLPDVLLRIADLPAILTDTRGAFSVSELRPGRYPIEVEFLGREPVLDTLVLEDAALVAVRIILAEAPLGLDPLVVEVEPRSLILDRAGFYARRDKSGIHGTRITRREIEQRPGARVSDLLRNVPSARIMSVASPPGAAIMRVNRLGNRYFGFQRPLGALPGCEPSVYVDGLLHFDVLNPPAGQPRLSDLNFLPTDVIEGIEVYTGMTAPARYDADGCGVILIWTRGYW